MIQGGISHHWFFKIEKEMRPPAACLRGFFHSVHHEPVVNCLKIFLYTPPLTMTTRFCRIFLQSGVGKLYIYRAVIERDVTKEQLLGGVFERW